MAKMASAAETSSVSTIPATICKDLPLSFSRWISSLFGITEISESFPQNYNCKDSYSDLFCHLLKVESVQIGRVSCLFSVLPFVTNYYNGLHGGAVAAIAERVAIACARTVVPEDKQLFVGELSVSYLSAATQNEDLVVDGSVLRSGRNLTVVAIEFKTKKSGKLVYTARATFYHMPPAKL
ncbi:hypothetical protein JCGZ_14443 [Jatropha curcas]|uniref:Thioesterase domain-containing protein n=1 Tax=Jatropha curcas TaxID=180498 RepID=A0A067JXQ8_JATCU|nr:hypothetical protein JCGZ_14443 [Jatropha curcas]